MKMDLTFAERPSKLQSVRNWVVSTELRFFSSFVFQGIAPVWLYNYYSLLVHQLSREITTGPLQCEVEQRNFLKNPTSAAKELLTGHLARVYKRHF